VEKGEHFHLYLETDDAAAQTVVFGSVQVDIDKVEVLREGEPVGLSAQEFKLLQYFVEHQQVVLSRNLLLDEVWGYNAMSSTRTVDVHVAGLRQKLEPDPRRPVILLRLTASAISLSLKTRLT
jgi:two-component system alkaline phosphatase synthesis response regulator PhoP